MLFVRLFKVQRSAFQALIIIRLLYPVLFYTSQCIVHKKKNNYFYWKNDNTYCLTRNDIIPEIRHSGRDVSLKAQDAITGSDVLPEMTFTESEVLPEVTSYNKKRLTGSEVLPEVTSCRKWRLTGSDILPEESFC